ncbi:aldehyde dehydrogenase [Novosphingobium sp. MMS21-SN21R]|uniref:aldehyde dehydrogenase n=1 Tax=Novosphingobium sp. MMS21-SN21R TaxID=2969298 RepID=UPI0028864DD8|nr:aldehyde dehydrogenase [Novosphingobium sp. MMS21-SN21R]MDT0508437.1 aldehyde dehydrogenase [Novosphingobium sp. MMS21-SN21R]
MPQSRNSFFIGNEWVRPASSRKFTLVNASTEEMLGTVPEAVEADVDAAVGAARKALVDGPWAKATPGERAAVMERFIGALAARGDDIARAVSAQNGMPLAVSGPLEGQFSIGVMQYYAGLAGALGQPDVRPSQMGKETLVERTPIGVVAAIVPWNFPVTLALNKVAPAMAAGCTLVIKPSPGTVLDSYIVAEAALEAGVPAGVLNWVAADRDVGAYLVSHPGVDKVAFTGSTGAGRMIARSCGELLRPVTLELGGKSAAILLDDVDVGAFLQGVPFACMLNNGQACYNGTRILAPRSRYGEVVDALAGFASALKVGDALDPDTHVGPMASSAHRDRVESYIAIGKDEARLVAGGGRPKGTNHGWFVEPTIFADVENSDRIAREEIFGPVLSVIAYDGEDDAVRIANDSDYGLGGSVWSADSAHALDIARRVESGTVGVNGYMPSLGAPFGGIKASGLGREFGPEAVGSYQQTKSIYVMG